MAALWVKGGHPDHVAGAAAFPLSPDAPNPASIADRSGAGPVAAA